MAFRTPVSILDIVLLSLAALCFAAYRLLRVPAHLRHIPTVPLWPLLRSYLSGEVEEQRVKRLVLPFAKQMQTDVVLVFCLGDWMVQILEPKVRRRAVRMPVKIEPDLRFSSESRCLRIHAYGSSPSLATCFSGG